MKGEKGIGGAVSATDGLSEELAEEAFSKQSLSAAVSVLSVCLFEMTRKVYALVFEVSE